MRYKIISGLFLGLLLATGVIMVLESAPTSQAPKSYLLKNTLKENDKEVIVYKLEAGADVSTPNYPKHPIISMYSKLEQEIEQKILKITDSQITRLERTYRSSKYYISKSSKSPKPEPLNGKKVVIESDGTITPTTQIAEEIMGFMSTDEHRFTLILPAEEVQIKSEWDVSSDVVTRIFNFANHKKRTVSHGCTEVGINARFTGGSAKCTLKEVKAVGGQESAVIEMTVDLKGQDNGLGLEATLKGTAIFGIKKEKFSKIELSGDITLDGKQPCTKIATEDKVTGKGKLKIAYEFK